MTERIAVHPSGDRKDAKGASIAEALPALIFAYNEVVAQASRLGIRIRLAEFGGMRDEAYTTLILKYRVDDWNVWRKANPKDAAKTTMEEWRKIAPYGSSMHNYGAAFDVEVYETPAGMSRLAALNIVKDLCVQQGLVDGRNFNDPPHAELRGGLAAARIAWAAEGHSGPYGPNKLGFITPDLLALIVGVGLLALFLFIIR